MRQKRAVAIHDISCVGRCSLTVALPILSAAGIETSVIPTAVLSTHTGGFTNYAYRDLTEDIPEIIRHWSELNLKTDAFYTGFLGSYKQINIVCDLIDKLRDDNSIIFVDPVMADNGSLYTTIDPKFPQGIKKLIKKADIIVPNITEAMLLLDMDFCAGPYTKEFIDKILIKLSYLGPKYIILTGVYFDDKQLGAASYDTVTKKIGYAFANKIEGVFCGTGDVFASSLLGALLNGISPDNAVRIAVDYTTESILRTKKENRDVRYGVNFECGLGDYINAIKKDVCTIEI